MKTKLDTVANIAIIVVCAVAAVILIRNNFFPPRPPGAPEQVEAGEQFDELKQVVPAGSKQALVIAVSPTCHFCTESIPFYKRLQEERNQKGSGVKLVTAVPAAAAREEETKLMTAGGFTPDSVVELNFATVKVPGTPTLMLVDKEGKVLNVWVGKLNEDGEKEVLKVL